VLVRAFKRSCGAGTRPRYLYASYHIVSEVGQHRPWCALHRISLSSRTFVRRRDAPASGLELVETALPLHALYPRGRAAPSRCALRRAGLISRTFMRCETHLRYPFEWVDLPSDRRTRSKVRAARDCTSATRGGRSCDYFCIHPIKDHTLYM
jgi:hypothetical protein